MEPTTSTPEINTTRETPEAVLKYVLSFEQIEDLRTRQRAAFYDAQREAHEGGMDLQEARPLGHEAAQRISDEYVTHVAESGYFNDETVKSIDDTVNKYSFLSMKDLDWRVEQKDDEGVVTEKSGIDQLRDDLEIISHKVSDGAREEEQTLESAKERLASLREQLAVLNAKRQGNIGGKGGEQYQEVLRAYNQQAIVVGKLETQDRLNDDSLTETEKNAIVIQHIFDEQNELRKVSTEKFANGRVQKWVTAIGKFFNTGTPAMRLVKGIGVGVAVGGVVALAGGLGAGAAAVAGAAALGVRFSRAYAMSEAAKNSGIHALDESAKQSANYSIRMNGSTDLDEIFKTAQANFDRRYEADTKNEQKERRKSMYKAAGAVALGLVLGTAGHMLVTGGDAIGFGHGGSGTESHVSVVEQPGSQHVFPDIEELQDVPAPEAAPVYDLNFFVEPGEGGIHLFQDMGLTEANWYTVHQELLQNFPNDFYPMPGGQVGLVHSGQLSIEAQEFIKAKFGMP